MSLWTPLLWLLIISPLFIIAYIKSEKTEFKYVVVFVVYFLLDCYLNSLDFMKVVLPDLRWNWDGKISSLLLSLTFILFNSKEIKKDIGFTTSFNRRTKLGVLIFIGFLIFDFIFKFIAFPKGGEFDLESFIFQATMPGLTEEILYRGIYLWLLSKAFVSSKMIKGVPFGWSFIIVTVLFGVAHGIILTESFEIHYDIATIVYLTLISSFSLTVLRKFSGNLILPILGHNVINMMNFLIRLM
ncbi:CPBP family intramembrane metalloprotease [Cellulophaga sp. HaHaR_3_176]|uniref:CPBP family intramembrane glutamic endopeptidase n=1 Tax=Cellulophaga sp. HaHaR_3_176 TaxID=1942464 RepID=UPI001C1F943B|nr:CPBP family intramembrane glutamic endopeptidase [Cellulophaga sp. HaHaR_3_176]QWX85401.1 CPBP family intramembrane metalloprotease [Cellulophaga sp. HaHaR_3_176]